MGNEMKKRERFQFIALCLSYNVFWYTNATHGQSSL